MALFGTKSEETFMLLHPARREIEVASEMLTWRLPGLGQWTDDIRKLAEQLHRDIWDMGGFGAEKDRVGKN
jgi:hypothetical protein